MVGLLLQQREKVQEQLNTEAAKNSKLHAENQDLKDHVKELEDQVHRCELEYSSTNNSLTSEVANLKQSLAMMEERAEQQRKVKQNLHARLNEQDAMMLQAQAQRDRLMDESKRWQSESVRFREDVQYLTEQTNLLLDELQTE